jgi:nonsense-mediated mRNA decay protein 3
MEKICPRCGISGSEREFVGHFCVRCYPVKVSVPAEVKIARCKRCERIRDREWKNLSNEFIIRSILRECKGNIQNPKYEDGVFSFSIPVGQKLFELKRNVLVSFVPTLCVDCSRESGGYFEAIIQLRGDEKNVERMAKMLEREVGKKTFIPKIVSLKEGVDIYVGNKKAVEAVLSRIKYKRTEKLAGERDGKRLYRSTFGIRL